MDNSGQSRIDIYNILLNYEHRVSFLVKVKHHCSLKQRASVQFNDMSAYICECKTPIFNFYHLFIDMHACVKCIALQFMSSRGIPQHLCTGCLSMGIPVHLCTVCLSMGISVHLCIECLSIEIPVYRCTVPLCIVLHSIGISMHLCNACMFM